MVQQSKQTLLFILFGFSLLYEIQSGVYVVYPFGVDRINSLKPTFSSRKLDSDVNEGNIFNKTHLHLIYPVNEELVIMTPSPMEEINEMFLEATTESPAPFSDETDKFMATYEATEPPEVDLLRMDLDSSATVTDIPDVPTVPLDIDGLRIGLDLSTAISEDTTSYDTDSTTDTITTEIPIPQTEPTHSESQLLPIYDTTGPIKLLRKRMFEFNKYVPSTHIKLLKKNSNIMVTSTTPRMYRKRYNILTTAVPSTIKEKLSSSKKVTDLGTAIEESSDIKKERRRYTYKKWSTKSNKNQEGGAITSSGSKTESSGKKQRKSVGQEDNAENRQ